MSKKDFVAVGDGLRPFFADPADGGEEWNADTPADILTALCNVFARINPQFKEQRFREYVAGRCGPNGGAVKTTGAR